MLVARVSRPGALRAVSVSRAYSSAPPRLVGRPTGVAVPPRPLTSALVGFLGGAALAAATGLYWIRHEYTQASTSVMQSSERLTDMANHVTQYLDRIAELEQRVRRIEKQQITRDEVTHAWDSHRKLYSDMFEESHELKERLWQLEHTIFATRTRTEPVAWDLVPARPPPLPPVRLL
ncbi:Uncharacterized protein MSYG_1541 [Malassezia sympodialis ATCC 42132]|uniref:Uncharacterized protein n=1 Tax=Malassezia sympodialis (strain ATCC 42132) TaxID=1230383 RepID=A0A1M8A409_MALS4|nr:Uncharacterized protein MSYG_1541 [Malassezia sympodialis ATCC 42132]